LKVTVLSVTEDTVRFTVEGCDAAFANALRRTMMTDVPTMAVDDIFFFDNTSVVPDEVLAHRIGMTPLKTDLEHYTIPTKCDCGQEMGCPKCRVTLNMNVEAVDANKTVYSGDLVPVDPAITPVTPFIPLAKVAPGQSIKLEAYAQLGTGRIHSKWSPVSMAVFHNIAEITTDAATAAKCHEESPSSTILKGKDTLKVVDIQAFMRSPTCRALVGDGSLQKFMKRDQYVFTVESTGALPPMKVVQEAVKILNEKMEELKHKLAAGEVHEDIEDFALPTEVGRRLYSIGAGDFDEDEEGEEGGGEKTFDQS